MKPIVFCADIGSIATGKFAWVALPSRASGDRPSSLANAVAIQLRARCPVALGFECPLFVPINEQEECLGHARPGDGNRSWSAGAGPVVLATGLVQVTWILQEIRKHLHDQISAYLDWSAFKAAGSGLFLWEAFVSGKGKTAGHLEDACAAAEAFESALPDPGGVNAVVCSTLVFSLVGAALLRAGWSSDLGLLSQACLVIKAADKAT